MANPRKNPSPEELEPIRQQIQAWRAARKLPGPMPSEIWNGAVVLARQFGVCKVARAVGIDYTALRQKVTKAMESCGLVKPTFVELPGRLVSEERSSNLGAVIEISTPDGSRVRVQLESGRGMEAAGIVAAFLGSRG